jgi:terminase small subunit-like protein
MPLLTNPRHELFCQAIASGRPAIGAYKLAGYKNSSAKASATRLMENDGISSRIAELRAQQSTKSEFSRDQLRQFLIHIVTAKPEQASMQNPLCEIAITKKGPAAVFPDKLGAAAQLAKLTGWNSVEKVSVETGDTLSAFLRQVVAK